MSDLVADRIHFFVEGVPQPGGSKKMIPNRKYIGQRHILTAGLIMKLAFIVEDAKGNARWRKACRAAAIRRVGGLKPVEGPLAAKFVFVMPRPLAHFGTGRNAAILKPSAPACPTKRPDTTKLVRSTEDALTEVLWMDDAQLVWQCNQKRYARPGEPAGAYITVWPYPSPEEASQEEMVF